MGTESIYNYRQANESLVTAGQPTPDQLSAAAQEGFARVINLAPHEPPHTLSDEASLVRSLGMEYHHIPVEWTNPQESDFEAFDQLMSGQPAGKTLLHCVANFRASAFYALYAMKRLGWSEEQAEAFRGQIWQGSDWPVWEQFIANLKSKIKA